MHEDTPQAPTPAAAWRPGLRIHDRGAAGVVVEATADHHLAVARHARVLAFVDHSARTGTSHPGGLLVLQHVTDNLALSEAALWLATGEGAVAYAHGDDHYLEWTDPQGWRDRRLLSPATVASIHALGDWRISRADRQWAARQLRQLVPEARGQHVWSAFLSDAQAWWSRHASGPLRDHALGLRRLQLLTRADLACGASGRPQAPAAGDETVLLLPDLAQFPESGRRSGELRTITELRVFTASLARDRGSKPAGRAAVIDRINLLLPRAAGESQACVHGLGAFRHALVAGGAQGRLWAPRTVAEYVREGLEPLVRQLDQSPPDTLDGAAWHALYTRLMQAISSTQRGKFSAFIQVFHRFMVIAGAEPLPWPLLPGEPLRPPAAAVVHPAQVELALHYVDTRAPSEQVRLQARIILRLGSEVPMRTYEYWCLRVGDVQGGQDLSLVIYPRLLDGICKQPHVRRVEDIHGLLLRRDLLALQRLRRDQETLDEDVLFGVSGQPLGRHREALTNALVNTALRWATGRRLASIYDLRHSCFSRLAETVLRRKIMSDDTIPALALSARGGHGDPMSKLFYIHQVEVPLAEYSQQARPTAWQLPVTHHAGAGLFPDLCDGQLTDRPPIPEGAFGDDPLRRSQDLTLAERAALLWDVQRELRLGTVAQNAKVDEATARLVIDETVEALVELGLAGEEAERSLLSRYQTLVRWQSAAVVSKQVKHAALRAHLDTLLAQSKWSSLNRLWRDWRNCRQQEWVSVLDGRPAARLIQSLLDAGVPRDSLAIVSVTRGTALPGPVASLGLQSGRPVKPYRGRAAHRLVMTAHGVSAAQARGGAVTMTGLHWWFVVLVSALIARGEL